MQTATDTARAPHRANPDERRLKPLADNAFRRLGLPSHASQREIYAAAASLRRAIKLGVARPPAHQLDWLGSLDRTENGVRDALSRLTIPAQRIYERFFWFFDPQAAQATEPSLAALRDSAARLEAAEHPAAGHDMALLSLAVMLRLDPELRLADDWGRACALWKEVIEGREFWSSLMAADLKGDFEQVTTFGEIGDLRARAWRLLTAPLKEIANDAIGCGDHAQARRALVILGNSNLPQTLADEYEQEILGPVEDEFDVLLHEAFSSYRYESKTYQSSDERRAACWRAHAGFNEQVKPALKNLLELAGAESTLTRRVFADAAAALAELAEGFETGSDSEASVKMLRKAWKLAPPDSASLLLVEERLAAAGQATGRQPKTEAGYARQLAEALREPVGQLDLFRAYVQKEEAEKSLERWGKGASRFIFFVVCALLVGKCFNSLPGSRRPARLPAMNLNMPAPRFTPAPTPKFGFASLIERITVRELQDGLKARTVSLLHVGAKGDYETGHIPGALSVEETEVGARARRLPKNRRIVLYCRRADQEASTRAAVELHILGFPNVFLLEGGYRAWLDAGLPTAPARSGLVRQGSVN